MRLIYIQKDSQSIPICIEIKNSFYAIFKHNKCKIN